MKLQAVLVSLLTIGLAGSMLGVGTFAYFSDVESSTNNLIQAGTIDLAVNGQNPWNQAGVVIDDLKPCKVQYVEVTVKNVGGNPGTLYLHFADVITSGGEQTEPENQEPADDNIAKVVRVDIDNEWIGYMDNIASEQYFLGILQPGQENTLTLSFHMDENVTNWAQGDTCTFTLEFVLEQLQDGLGPL